jgi:response regulator RpfG family c-di-GMP phosphodiesterase
LDRQKHNLLFVDDEQNILDGIRRNLGRVFNVHTALGADEALGILKREGPFAVVVSDMRMPGMDGIRFLAIVRDQWPDSVRVMLTGNADLETAISAVNEGNIFRFVTKPCPAETLIKIMEACLSQYNLVKAERELLEKTLKGSIKVLVEILSLTNPAAFSRAMRIRHYVIQMAKTLNASPIWQYEVAAMLSQIGYVTVPSETIEKILAGENLSESEEKMVSGHSEVGRDLTGKIPRLEVISEMIAYQSRPFKEFNISNAKDLKKPEIIGSGLLKAAIDFDTLLLGGARPEDAIASMSKKTGIYYPTLLDALRKVNVPTFDKTIRSLKISELRNGMILAENIRTSNGLLIVTKGQEVNDILRKRLDNFSGLGNTGQSVRVYVAQQNV